MEKATIKFIHEDGREIVVNATYDGVEDLTVSIDFGDGGASAHGNELHAGLSMAFMKYIAGME